MQLDDFSCKWHQSVDCERLTVQAQKGGTRGSRAAHIAVNERMVERDPDRQCCCLPRQVCACVVGRGMGAVHRRFGQGAAPRLAGSAVGKTVGEGSTRSGQRRHRQSGSGTRPANCRRAARTPRPSRGGRQVRQPRAVTRALIDGEHSPSRGWRLARRVRLYRARLPFSPRKLP